MAEAFWNPVELQLLAVQIKACPLPKLGRAGAQVDGNIPDVAGKRTHQLALRLAKLIVQAPQPPA
jgi:hypothetical protein